MTRRLRCILPSIIGFVGVFAIVLLLYGLTAPLGIHQRRTPGSTIVLENGIEAGQHFTAHFPGLSRISVHAALLPEGSLDGLTFHLMAGESEDGVLVLSENEVHIEVDQDWIHFRFPPLPDPAPRLYSFYLADESAQPITLYTHPSNMYPEGARISGEGDLVFEASFRPSITQTLVGLLSRLSEGKPGVLGNPWTYALLLTGLAVSYSKLALNLYRSLREKTFKGS